MILSHQKKFIYFHIYKVAGSSIKSALKEYDDLSARDFPWYKNLQFFIGKSFHSLSTLAVDHLKAGDAKKLLPAQTFNDYYKFTFVRNPWDWQVSLYHYMLQYTKHPQHKKISKMKTFDEYIDWRINYDMEFQQDFILDKNGKQLVDFVGRFENIQNDFNKICQHVGLQQINLPVINTSKHKPYKDYYNDKTREQIQKAFKKDIDLFQYTF